MSVLLELAPEVAPDPPVRRNKRCVQCRGPRGRTVPEMLHGGARAAFVTALESDPFCSSGCARAWHGVHDAGEKAGAHEKGARDA